jgi:hypothetical protein
MPSPIRNLEPNALSISDLRQLPDINHSYSGPTLLNINMDCEKLKGSISNKFGPRVKYDSQGDKVGLSLSSCGGDSTRSSPKSTDFMVTKKNISGSELVTKQTKAANMIDKEVTNVMKGIIDKIVFAEENDIRVCEKIELKNASGPKRERDVGKQLTKLSDLLLGKTISATIKSLLCPRATAILETNVEVPIRKDDIANIPLSECEKSATSCYDDELSQLPKLTIVIPKSSYITPMYSSEQSPMHRIVSTNSLHDCYDCEGKQTVDCNGYASNGHSCVSFPRHSPRGFTPRAPGSSAI